MSNCASATCGDGEVEAGVEECDDENTDNSDDCLNSCKNAYCGDSVMKTTGENIEVCDDGNNNENDGCTNAC